MENIDFNEFLNPKSLAEHNRNASLQFIRKLEEHPKTCLYDSIIESAKVGEKEEFFRLFNKFNPDIAWTDQYNNDFMQYAVSGGEIAIVKFLVEKGSKINHPGRYNITPLMRTCMMYMPRSRKRIKSLILYLLEIGADTSLVDDREHNALFYAKRQRCDEELCKLLTPPVIN
jgi:ankyrin repeat protein